MSADSQSLTAAAQTGFVLLQSEDDPIDDTPTDLGGTNIAECESSSRVTKIDLNCVIRHANVGTRIVAVLLKAPDGTAPGNLTATNWLSATMTQAERDFKANILWRRVFVTDNSSTMVRFRIKLNRKWNSLRRLGKMSDGDSLILRFFNTHDSVAGSLERCDGTIVTRR